MAEDAEEIDGEAEEDTEETADVDTETLEVENEQEQSCSLETWQQNRPWSEDDDAVESAQDGTGILGLNITKY